MVGVYKVQINNLQIRGLACYIEGYLPGAAFWSGTHGMVRILEVREANKALDLPKNNLNLGHL